MELLKQFVNMHQQIINIWEINLISTRIQPIYNDGTQPAKGPQVLGPRSAEVELTEELDMYYSSSFLLNE